MSAPVALGSSAPRRGRRPRRLSAMSLPSTLRSVAPRLVAALAGVALASAALGQGPDSGSPFVDAPLDVEALKAPPDSAFEVLMISLGVFLLVPLTAAAFIALARLRNLEEGLRKCWDAGPRGA